MKWPQAELLPVVIKTPSVRLGNLVETTLRHRMYRNPRGYCWKIPLSVLSTMILLAAEKALHQREYNQAQIIYILTALIERYECQTRIELAHEIISIGFQK